MEEAGRFVAGFNEHDGKTTLHPIGVTLLLCFGIAMLLVPRRYAMITMIACASFVAVGQRVVVATLDFNFIRIMVLFGCARLLMRQEFRGFQWSRMDKFIVAFAIAQVMTYTVTVGPSGFIWRLGTAFESIGTYFLTRMLVRDLNDVRMLIFGLVVISIPVAFIFLVERSTGRNLFAAFGGVPEFTQVRDGKLRCQGAYAHPVIAGCYWAAIFPLFASQLFSKGLARVFAIFGSLAALTIVFCCASSTPVTGILAAIIGFALMPLRRRMVAVLWALVAVIIVLQIGMKAPVWYLIARTDFVGGSTGWHRAHLIDKVVEHFDEWFISGVMDITHWDVFGNDVCNQYCLIAVQGGLPTLLLFTALIVVGFGNVGRAWRRVTNSPDDVRLIWAMGVSLFVHNANFVGLGYFGQIDSLLFISLALTTVAQPARSPLRSVGSTIAARANSSVTRMTGNLHPGYR
jgi:hypothetical protein